MVQTTRIPNIEMSRISKGDNESAGEIQNSHAKFQNSNQLSRILEKAIKNEQMHKGAKFR